MTTNKRFSVEDKVILVTGASSGIGEHFCQTLAAEGAKVVACARRVDRLQALVEHAQSLPGSITAVPMDVNDSEGVKRSVSLAADQFGVPDVLCNNAGIAIVKPFLNLEEEDWNAVINTDLNAVFRVGRAVAKLMKDAGNGGSIINTASILGERALYGYAAYTAAKAGVIQLTRNMALDLIRFGIRTNAIAPGFFRTEINDTYVDSEKGQADIARTPSRREGQLEELEGALLLLASSASSFMNGSVITVDGGHSVALL